MICQKFGRSTGESAVRTSEETDGPTERPDFIARTDVKLCCGPLGGTYAKLRTGIRICRAIPKRKHVPLKLSCGYPTQKLGPQIGASCSTNYKNGVNLYEKMVKLFYGPVSRQNVPKGFEEWQH